MKYRLYEITISKAVTVHFFLERYLINLSDYVFAHYTFQLQSLLFFYVDSFVKKFFKFSQGYSVL